jgi:hypothetical protein
MNLYLKAYWLVGIGRLVGKTKYVQKDVHKKMIKNICYSSRLPLYERTNK